MTKDQSLTWCRCCKKTFNNGQGKRTRCPHCEAENGLPEMCTCKRVLVEGECPRPNCNETT